MIKLSQLSNLSLNDSGCQFIIVINIKEEEIHSIVNQLQ